MNSEERIMVKIAPSILNADFSCLGEQIRGVEQGGADWIHLDIMDGHFVPNITIGPMVVQAVRRVTRLPLDVHLMISDADRYIDDFHQAGADLITVHVEACPHLWRTLETIREMGCKTGITLNPATPLMVLQPVLHLLDLVLVMSVEPGFGGQKFIPDSLDRIKQLSSWRREHNYKYLIEVDGGIDINTAPQVVAAGADVLVIGKAIFSQADIPAAVQAIRNKLIG